MMKCDLFYSKLITTLSVLLLYPLYPAAQTEIPVYLDDTRPVEERIEHALSLMTLEEKIAMCHAQSKFSTPGCPRLGIPEIWMSDGPHGVRMEFEWDTWTHAGWSNDSCTAFPALTCLAATFNPELSYAYGKALGEEARYRKKDVILGPGVNIYRTPLSGRNFEYMGEDPYLSSVMVVPYIRGVQQSGVAACIKHFALNNQEKWRNSINVNVSDRALNEIYFPAFKAGVKKGGVWAVMGSYNRYRGVYCSHNEILINKILKGDWQFDGVLITDWGSARDTEQAARYGLDIEMGTWTNGLTWGISSAYDEYYLARPFYEKIKAGELSETLLDEKIRRILRLCFRTNMNRNRPWGKFTTPEHARTARKIAEEGIVLMKNDRDFFPVPEGKYKKIAVIGENAVKKLTEGGGSSELKPKREISPLQGLIDKYGKEAILYSMGYASGPPSYDKIIPSPYDADSLLIAAVEVARQADIVLFIGGLNKNNSEDCEGDDRKTMSLPFGQDRLIGELLKANPNLGVILISGNAVEMPWLKQVPALMQAWYAGSEAGHALANVISGEVNPSGKLPFSFPKHLADNSAHYFGPESYPGDSLNVYYKDDILVGYRWHDTRRIAPRFAFGHGLSYTTFKYGAVKTDKKNYTNGDTIRIAFTITNTGRREGAEVAQIYVGQKNPSVIRPVKELKGFQKVFLKPGETKHVVISVAACDLAYYDESGQGWYLEPDRYIIYCASASDRIEAKTQINIREPAAKEKSIILAGASFAVAENGWFEAGCKELGRCPVNKAVSGEAIYHTANRMADGTFYTPQELENCEALVVMHVHNQEVGNEAILKESIMQYDMPTRNYSIGYDYVIKRYIKDCYDLRDNPRSRYYRTKNGKPVKIVLCTHWNDSRTTYNSAIRKLAGKWNLPLIEWDTQIGFSKESPDENGRQYSLKYAGDTETIQGIRYGWHPLRGQEQYIQQKMKRIFVDKMSEILK